MEFRLVYDGPLKASAGVNHKHELRKAFHKQLKVLWNQPPLNRYQSYFQDPPKGDGFSVVAGFDDYKFVPLVCKKLRLICELDITLLRPGAPGSIVTKGGDIDNRLKTLFDSLRMPKNQNELPRGISPEDLKHPFFCLLEDDSLITKVGVSTDRLLREGAGQNDVVMIIHVTIKAVERILGNAGIG